jgi:hypothetical protein
LFEGMRLGMSLAEDLSEGRLSATSAGKRTIRDRADICGVDESVEWADALLRYGQFTGFTGANLPAPSDRKRRPKKE